MKKFLGKLFRLFIFVSYPILIVALIVTIAIVIVRTREINDLNSTFSQAQNELNAENQNKQVTVTDLRTELQDLTNKVTQLKAQNDALQSSQLSSYAIISGKIFPFVTTGSADFSQYQRVCAELATNTNQQYCVTVSAVQQTYTLSVPAGTYHVYAELFPTPKSDSPLYGMKAYYTTYVKCVHEQSADKCIQKNLTAPVDVTLKAGDNVTSVDPIDWKKS